MNILFKIEGGEKVGLGHVYRSFELSKEFVKDGRACVAFFSNFDINLIPTIRAKKQEAPLFLSKEKDGSEINDLLKILRDEVINIVIIDQRSPAGEICRSIKRENPHVFVVGLDFFEYRSPIDLIINLFNQSILESPKISKNYCEGVQYAIIREDLRKYHNMKRKISDHVKEIVITFGGADPNGNTLKTVRLLNEIKDRKFVVNVVQGRSFAHQESIAKFVSNSTHDYRIFENIECFDNLISKSDLGFCGAGTTLMEFCAVGTPAIVYPQTEQEERFATYIEKNGACKTIIEKASGEEKIDIVRTLIDNADLRRQMSTTQKSLIDVDGKKRIRTIILSKYREYNQGEFND